MVDLSLERPGEHLYIRAVDERGIQVVDDWHRGSVIVGQERVSADWAPDRIERIAAHHLEAIFRFEPEVVIIGTGERQVFLPPELMMEFHTRGIGAEVMTTAAACRTFNVLISEGRNVVAALLPPGS